MARLLLSATIGLISIQLVTVGLVVIAAPYFPEGEVIAYVAYGKSSEDIFILDVNRGTSHNLTYLSNSNEREPEWSPDGSRIVFSSWQPESNMSDIYVMDMNGGNLRQLTPTDNEHDFSPAWSPNGSQIVYSAYQTNNTDIFIMNSDGSNVTRRTDSPLSEGSPAWSPDGRLIAFSLTHESATYIALMDAVGGDERQITPGNFISPVWSPDSTKLAYLGGGFRAHLYFMDVATRQVQTISIQGSLHSLTWLPDSQRVAFVSDLGTSETDVYVMDVEGGDPLPFPFGGYNGSVPVWRPT